MDISQRIALIKAIAEAFEIESWPDTDLVLRQFHMPTWDDWHGDKRSYIIASIENANEEELVGLATHFGIVSPSVSNNSKVAQYWIPENFRLFLSHVSACKKDMTALRESLLPYHISCFVAHEDIEPTKEWQSEIEGALQTCDALAAYLTPEFHESNWTDQEVGAAIGRGILVLPLRNGLDPYGFIGKYQALTITGQTFIAIARQMFNLLCNHPVTNPMLTEYVVSSFVNSWSWESARFDMSLLEDIRSLNQSQLTRIEKAVETNSKLKDTFTVPDRVRRLLTNHKRVPA
jgi:hypothetical protein